MFGGGPLIARLDLDVSDWSLARLLWTLGAAAVGAGGLLLVISSLVSALLPVEFTLENLPPEQVTRINANAASLLPRLSNDLAEFRERLRSYQQAAATLQAKVRSTEAADKPRLETALADVTANLDRYRQVRAELLAHASFDASSRIFDTRREKIAWGTVFAVLGGTLYLLLVSGKAPDDGKKGEAEGGGSAPAVAVLSKIDDPTSKADAGQIFWDKVGLEACETESGSGKVHVLKMGGTGSADDPYQVQTLGIPEACAIKSFSVADAVAVLTVDEPQKLEITYQEQEEDAKSND